MKIIKLPPPNWDRIKAAFPEVDEEHVVITYGDNIHILNPKLQLSNDVIIHEMTHTLQQKDYEGGVEAWWDRYLSDTEFRLSQEIQAYRTQYRAICNIVKDRNKRAKELSRIAGYLSGATYGRAISYGEATQKIRDGIK